MCNFIRSSFLTQHLWAAFSKEEVGKTPFCPIDPQSFNMKCIFFPLAGQPQITRSVFHSVAEFACSPAAIAGVWDSSSDRVGFRMAYRLKQGQECPFLWCNECVDSVCVINLTATRGGQNRCSAGLNVFDGKINVDIQRKYRRRPFFTWTHLMKSDPWCLGDPVGFFFFSIQLVCAMAKPWFLSQRHLLFLLFDLQDFSTFQRLK